MMNKKTKGVLLIVTIGILSLIDMYLPGPLLFLALLTGLLFLPILAILSLIVIGASMVRHDISKTSKSTEISLSQPEIT